VERRFIKNTATPHGQFLELDRLCACVSIIYKSLVENI